MNIHTLIIRLAEEYGYRINEEEAETVAWECTGYPCWWPIPRLGRTPTQCFVKQLRHAFRWRRRYGRYESILDYPLPALGDE